MPSRPLWGQPQPLTALLRLGIAAENDGRAAPNPAERATERVLLTAQTLADALRHRRSDPDGHRRLLDETEQALLDALAELRRLSGADD